MLSYNMYRVLVMYWVLSLTTYILNNHLFLEGGVVVCDFLDEDNALWNVYECS